MSTDLFKLSDWGKSLIARRKLIQKILDRYTISDYVYDISLAKRELGDDCDPLFLKAIASLEFCLSQGKPFDLDAKLLGFLSSSDIAQEMKLYITVLLESLYADPKKFHSSIYESLNAIWLQCLSTKVLSWYIEVKCWNHILHAVTTTSSVAIVNLGCDMLSFLATKDEDALKACRDLIVAYFIDNNNKTTNIALILLLSLISAFSGRGEFLFPTTPFSEPPITNESAFAVLGSIIEKNEQQEIEQNAVKLEWTKIVISGIFSLIIDGDVVLQSKLVFVLKSMADMTFYVVHPKKLEASGRMLDGSHGAPKCDYLQCEIFNCCVAMLLMHYIPAGKAAVLRNRNPTQEAVNALVEQLEKQSHHRKDHHTSSVHEHVTSYDKYLEYIEQEQMSQMKHKSIYEISRSCQQNASEIGGAVAHHKDIMEVISLKTLFSMLPQHKDLYTELEVHKYLIYHIFSFLSNINRLVEYSLSDLIINKDSEVDSDSESESDVEDLDEEPYILDARLNKLMYDTEATSKTNVNVKKQSRRASKIAALQVKIAKVSVLEHIQPTTGDQSLSSCVLRAEKDYIYAQSQLVDMQEKQFHKIVNPVPRFNRKQSSISRGKMNTAKKVGKKGEPPPRKTSGATPSYLKETTRSRTMSISKKNVNGSNINSPAGSRRGSVMSPTSRKPSIISTGVESEVADPGIDPKIASLLESSHARVSNMETLDEELHSVHSSFSGLNCNSNSDPPLGCVSGSGSVSHSRTHSPRNAHAQNSIQSEHNAHGHGATQSLVADSLVSKPASIDTTMVGSRRDSRGTSPTSFATMAVSPFAVGSTTHQQALLKRYMEKQNIPRIINFYALLTSVRMTVLFLQVYIEINPLNSRIIEKILKKHGFPICYMEKNSIELVDLYSTFCCYLHILMRKSYKTSVDISSSELLSKLNEYLVCAKNQGDLNSRAAHFNAYLSQYRDLSHNSKLNEMSSCTMDPPMNIGPGGVGTSSLMDNSGSKLYTSSAPKIYKRYQHVSKFDECGDDVVNGESYMFDSIMEESVVEFGGHFDNSDCELNYSPPISTVGGSPHTHSRGLRIGIMCSGTEANVQGGASDEEIPFNSKFPMLFKQSTADVDDFVNIPVGTEEQEQNGLDGGSFVHWPSAAAISSPNRKRSPVPPKLQLRRASVTSPKVKLVTDKFSTEIPILCPFNIPSELIEMSDTPGGSAGSPSSPISSRPNTYQRILYDMSSATTDFGDMGLMPRSPPIYGRCGIVDGNIIKRTITPSSPIRTRSSPKSPPKSPPKSSPPHKRSQSPVKGQADGPGAVATLGIRQDCISPTADNWANYMEHLKEHSRRKVFNTAAALVLPSKVFDTSNTNKKKVVHHNVAEKYAKAMMVATKLKEQAYFVQAKGNTRETKPAGPSCTNVHGFKKGVQLPNPRLFIDPKWISGKSTMPLLVGKQPGESSKS